MRIAGVVAALIGCAVLAACFHHRKLPSNMRRRHSRHRPTNSGRECPRANSREMIAKALSGGYGRAEGWCMILG